MEGAELDSHQLFEGEGGQGAAVSWVRSDAALRIARMARTPASRAWVVLAPFPQLSLHIPDSPPRLVAPSAPLKKGRPGVRLALMMRTLLTMPCESPVFPGEDEQGQGAARVAPPKFAGQRGRDPLLRA